MHTSEREGLRARLPLYSYFCDFYALLVKVKRELAAVPAGQTVPDALVPAAVHARLVERLREQYSTVQRDCTPDQRDIYRDAQYAMAALADEQLLLVVDWPGRSGWLNLTLESALFDTRHAGVRFYRLIDRLLAVPMPTQAHAELGLVLLGALEVGFRGVLRGDHEAASLATRREELVKFVCEVRGDQASRHAFEQAYEHTLGPTDPEPANCRLAPLSPWFNAARLAFVAYLIVSAAIWFFTMHPFRQLVADDPTAQQVRAEQRAGKVRITLGERGTDPTQASGAVSVSGASATSVVGTVTVTPLSGTPSAPSAASAAPTTSQGGAQ